MKDDDIEEQAAAFDRISDSAADELLERFAAGHASEASVRRALVGDEDAEATIAAYRPLDARFRGAVVEKLLTACETGTPAEAPCPGAAALSANPSYGATQDETAADDTRKSATPGRVTGATPEIAGGAGGRVTSRGWRGGWLAGGGVVAALAVAVALVSLPSVAALPEYSVRFTAGDLPIRGAGAPATAPPSLRADSWLEWVLRPATAVEGPVEVRGYLAQGRAGVPWTPPFEVSAQGTIRIAGRPAELGIPPGTWRLIVAVGRPGELPEDWREALGPGSALAPRGARHWQAFVQTLTREG